MLLPALSRLRQALQQEVRLPAVFIVPSAIALIGSLLVVAAFQSHLSPSYSSAQVVETVIQCSSETKDHPCENARPGVWGDWVSTQENNAWVEYRYSTPMRITAIKLIDQGSVANEIVGGMLGFDNNSSKSKALGNFGISSLSHQRTPMITIDPPVVAKTVRFMATTTSVQTAGASAGLAEFRVYATPAPTEQPPAEPVPPVAPTTGDTGRGVINYEVEVIKKAPLTIILKGVKYDAAGKVPDPVKGVAFTHRAELIGDDGAAFWANDFVLPSQTTFRFNPKKKEEIIRETIQTHLPFVIPIKNSFIKKRVRIIDLKTKQEVLSFDATKPPTAEQ